MSMDPVGTPTGVPGSCVLGQRIRWKHTDGSRRDHSLEKDLLSREEAGWGGGQRESSEAQMANVVQGILSLFA